MQIDATTATLIASAIGALSSGVTAIVILLINKRSEERRHLRELAMRAAVDNWLRTAEAAKEFGYNLPPLDVYIVHMLKLSDILCARDLTAETLALKLREVQQFVKVAMAEAENFTRGLDKPSAEAATKR